MQQNGEPSVEEILESIKKVIARDNRESAQVEQQKRESAGIAPGTSAAVAEHADDGDDEVLELGEDTALIEILDEIADEEAKLPDDNEVQDHEAQGDEVQTGESVANEGLITESATSEMRDSLAALAMIAEPSRPPQIVRSGETSLEGMTRELLRPMLAQWLDANLPDIVERLVKNEITRIAGKKG